MIPFSPGGRVPSKLSSMDNGDGHLDIVRQFCDGSVGGGVSCTSLSVLDCLKAELLENGIRIFEWKASMVNSRFPTNQGHLHVKAFSEYRTKYFGTFWGLCRIRGPFF
ncbi:hypothetical protein K1719_041564 [Acacia pycnantha]|nr:hypothetical protein K1719_041564 [Acacia pycnantha]